MQKIWLKIINEYIKGLGCDETCVNNPISCAKEQYAVRVLKHIKQKIIEQERKAGKEANK